MKSRRRMTASFAGATGALGAALGLVALGGSLSLLAAEQPPVPEPGTIVTVAGRGPLGMLMSGNFAGDGGPAIEARLANPWAVTVDAADNVLISDQGNQRVRKVDLNGIITTVVGSGPSGFERGSFAGNGGPATEARLNLPISLAVDSAGNLFIGDLWNHRVRKVSPDGIITTVAGKGAVGAWLGGFSGDGGPAIQSRLQMLFDVGVDARGNLLVSYIGNYRVCKVFGVAAPGLLAVQPFPE